MASRFNRNVVKNILSSIILILKQMFQSLAWQPYESGVLCIGGGVGDASLSLWNMNKLNPPTYRDVKFNGAVENMLWNKHSGELVVHWSYLKGRKQRTVMPVFASLDRIVDVLPVDKEMQVNAVMWNSDHTQLGTWKSSFRYFCQLIRLKLFKII